ncbi:DoxX family protein [Sediminitomix flava]|uniref:Putative membrane protein YphA (DoxX/SURF4 family) n=1 Tax=Sediminitomix flava TaxID=379075 RepID=A0A315ZIC0_SEDFL|nr:DoxX family protein [Sediminitomix flava]PWJ44568.1 putative membrane protein YphA (DoxX/SURF4 family) [Sediminitomix flava]
MTFKQLLFTDDSKTTIIIRLMVGLVFFSEGIQKFLYPSIRGAGRFEKIGLPSPEFLGSLVGGFEVLAGGFILFGLFTRFSSLITFTIMSIAIITTKLPILENDGIWKMLHDSRTDWAMFTGSLFLIFRGGGMWSFDRKLLRKM